MLINDVDFAALYQQQMLQAKRTEKSPAHWDSRAEQMAEKCAQLTDDYLLQLLEKIDLRDATSLFDMGCGPGTVALALADKLESVCGVDYSPGMLSVAARRAASLNQPHVQWIQRAWEENWSDLPRCDIAVASRSTLVGDMREAMRKLNNQARLRVYTTHLVSPSFVPSTILQAAGREVTELPVYIYALNVLWQMGIHAHVDFIRDTRVQSDNSCWDRFIDSMRWYLGGISPQEHDRLYDWYQQQDPGQIPRIQRDWALIWWDCVPEARLG